MRGVGRAYRVSKCVHICNDHTCTCCLLQLNNPHNSTVLLSVVEKRIARLFMGVFHGCSTDWEWGIRLFWTRGQKVSLWASSSSSCTKILLSLCQWNTRCTMWSQLLPNPKSSEWQLFGRIGHHGARALPQGPQLLVEQLLHPHVSGRSPAILI